MGEKPTQQELLRILWQKMAVDELAMSIAAIRFVSMNHFLRLRKAAGSLSSKAIVVWPAVKLLLDAEARRRLKITDLPRISTSRAANLRKLPVVITTRKELWQYLGFKHVNG